LEKTQLKKTINNFYKNTQNKDKVIKMTTLSKILRGTITSLLFLILIITIIIQFAFIIIKIEGNRIPDLINQDIVLDKILTGEELPPEATNIAKEYLDDYLNYIFYKRSYPSIETIDLSNIDKENINTTKHILSIIKNKTYIEYSTIEKIRSTTAFMTNNSIFLLISIAVIFIFLLLTITRMSFSSSTKIFGLALSLSGFINIILTLLLYNNISKIKNTFLEISINTILTNSLKKEIVTIATIYIIIGILLTNALILTEKYIKRRQK